MIVAGYILIAAAVIGFVFRPLFMTRGQLDRASHREGRRRQLLEDREMLYEAIRELDFDHRMGKVEEADYRQTRVRYEARAVELMKAIDKGNGRAGEVEDRIEQEVAALRRASKGKKRSRPACPDCKAQVPYNARFCPQCGASLGRR